MAQRPKKNNSPINSKYQPLKATVPFSSLVTNPSPTRRRTSPSSPSLSSDKRNKFRRSPDVNTSTEHRNLFSPLGSRVNLFKPVSKDKNGKNIRRTNSLETLSTSYINGQWPREGTPSANGFSHCNKSTQTQWDSDPEETPSNVPEFKTQVIGNNGSKETFKQCLQRKKQQSSQPLHGKQSPLQGDHSTFIQYYSMNYAQTKAVPIPQIPLSPKNTIHTRRSVEGLNIELEGLELEAKDDQVFARTPPEGHRHPVPVMTTPNGMKNADTQTVDSWIDNSNAMSPTTCKDKRNSPRCIVSPPPDKSPVKTGANISNRGSMDRESPPQQIPKYASPKPNNRFWFARGPPDGAEKIILSVEDFASDTKDPCSSCPDTSKSYIRFSKDSPFYSLESQQQRSVSKEGE